MKQSAEESFEYQVINNVINMDMGKKGFDSATQNTGMAGTRSVNAKAKPNQWPRLPEMRPGKRMPGVEVTSLEP